MGGPGPHPMRIGAITGIRMVGISEAYASLCFCMRPGGSFDQAIGRDPRRNQIKHDLRVPDNLNTVALADHTTLK